MTSITTKNSCRTLTRPLAVLLLSLTYSATLFATERFELHGLEFPQPKKAPILSAVGRVVSPVDFAVAGLTLVINRGGRVESLAWEYLAADSQKFEPYTESIQDIRFHPARYADKKISFELNAELIVSSQILGSPARLVLPVDSGGNVTQADLLVESARANGFRPPELVRFPSYFYRVPPVVEDTMLLPHIVVLRIDIDQSGSPKSREILFSSSPALADMILIASAWADYKPGDFQGGKIGGTVVLVVQFFRELKYPTEPWLADEPSASPLESLRIRWYPENVEFMQFPALRRTGKRTVGAALKYDRNSPKTAMIWVDANGRIRVESTRGVNVRADRKLLRERIEALRFHPGFRLAHDPDSGIFLERMFSLGAIRLAPIDSLTYEIQTDFSLRKIQFPLRTTGP